MKKHKIFGTIFEDFERVTEIIAPEHGISVTNIHNNDCSARRGWLSEGESTQRYVLVKLIKEELSRFDIFGGPSFLADGKNTLPMKNPPQSATKDKGWERAYFIVRFSWENTHLGIVGEIMETLMEKVPSCKICLEQTGHEEPAIIAKTDEIYNFATVVGAGFVKISHKKKKITLFGRSRSFTVGYEDQRNFYLGMTGHEFVAKLLQPELPRDYKVVVINSTVETSAKGGCEVMPEP